MDKSYDHLSMRLNRATSGHGTPAIKSNGKVFVTSTALRSRDNNDPQKVEANKTKYRVCFEIANFMAALKLQILQEITVLYKGKRVKNKRQTQTYRQTDRKTDTDLPGENQANK